MAATNSTTNLGLPQWVEGDKILREDLNTAFSEIDSVLNPAVAVHAYKTSAQSIPSSNPSQIVQFETELYDTHGMFDSIANNTRLTCKVDGYYLVVSRISFSAHTKGYRAVYIMKNGSLSFTGGTFGAKFMAPDIGSALLTVSGLFYLEVDDYLEMWAEQQSLANLTIPEGNFCMMKLA